MRPPPLLDLLGASWSLGAAVTGIAWSGAGAGFGLADGSLALATAEWEGGPALAPRAGGGLEVRTAERDPPPVSRLTLQHGTFVLGSDPAGGFLCGGADGSLVHVQADGGSTTTRHAGAATGHVALGRAGTLAQARGSQVEISGTAPAELSLPAPVTGLAFDPTGTRLAILHREGVTLWPHAALDAPPEPSACGWSADGSRLAVGFMNGAVRVWRSPEDVAGCTADTTPRALAFFADGRQLAWAGGAQPACWRVDQPGAVPEPFAIGSRAMSCVLACHPARALVAVGYDNGAALLCEPGRTDVLFLRDAGGGAVTALAWSADGARLAIGTAEGELGAVSLPTALFRTTKEEIAA